MEDKTLRNPWYMWAAIVDGKIFGHLLDAKKYLMAKGKTETEAILFLNQLPVDRDSVFEWMERN